MARFFIESRRFFDCLYFSMWASKNCAASSHLPALAAASPFCSMRASCRRAMFSRFSLSRRSISGSGLYPLPFTEPHCMAASLLVQSSISLTWAPVLPSSMIQVLRIALPESMPTCDSLQYLFRICSKRLRASGKSSARYEMSAASYMRSGFCGLLGKRGVYQS